MQRKARKNADLFLRLGQEVTHFKNDLKQKVESKKQEVGDTFEEIEKKIAELESSLEKLVLHTSLSRPLADKKDNFLFSFYHLASFLHIH